MISKMTKGLGCVKPVFDPRDYQFSDIVSGIGKKQQKPSPDAFMYFPEVYYPPRTVIFDQGDSEMCCACAVSAARYIQEYNLRQCSVVWSPYYIYGKRCKSTSTSIDGVYTGEGMYLKDALKQLIKSGIAPLISCYNRNAKNLEGCNGLDLGPYDGITYNKAADICTRSFAVEAYEKEMCGPYRISSYYAVNGEKEIQQAIAATGCVIASFLVTTGWYRVEKDGIIRNDGMILGAHAVLIVGWKPINGKKYWIIQNSWGEEWGSEGFGFIEFDESKWILEAYCMIDDVDEKNDDVEKEEEK